MSDDAKKTVEHLLSLADVKIGGRRTFDIQVYDERFYRMWEYYLLSCAGGFRSRHLQL